MDSLNETSKDEDQDTKADVIQLVVFELDSEEYAVEITDIREIVRIPEITPVPDAPAFIKGIFNLRGQIVVVLDLEKKFGLKREHTKLFEHVVILESGKSVYGVLVDTVLEVLRVSKKSIKNTPDLVTTKIHTDFIKGIVVIDKKKKKESRIIVLLDLLKVLNEKELLKVEKSVAKENKREK
ncbi:chemotaxis protein CheW [Patescibacteria group bacterium]|nr:chemotaxis protein CheW [Patescibacteria group bacterium]